MPPLRQLEPVSPRRIPKTFHFVVKDSRCACAVHAPSALCTAWCQSAEGWKLGNLQRSIGVSVPHLLSMIQGPRLRGGVHAYGV